MTIKVCTKCQESKQLDCFAKKSNGKFGVKSICKDCSCLDTQLRYSNNLQINRLKAKLKRENNLEKSRIVSKLSSKKWRLSNIKKAKEIANKNSKRYAKLNQAKINAHNSKYRAIKLQATPRWLTEKQFKEIEQFYLDAKECQWLSEDVLEVDHIVPLKGENVSGLHVPWNLRVIPASKNRSKGNRYLQKDL